MIHNNKQTTITTTNYVKITRSTKSKILTTIWVKTATTSSPTTLTITIAVLVRSIKLSCV